MSQVVSSSVMVEQGRAERRVSTGRPRISVVIPAKNEALNIGWVIGRLPEIVDELIVVDGRSTDATIEVARSLWPDVVVVQDDRPGKGAALRAGFAAATGDYVVMMDGDGSMDPLEIPSFIERLDAGSDLVKGSRFLDGGGSADFTVLRSLGTRALLVVANVLIGGSSSELCYGYAAFRRTRILDLDLTATGFEGDTQLFLRAIRNGLQVDEVPCFEAPRRNGTSNFNTFRDGWRVLQTILEEWVRPRTLGSVPAFRTDFSHPERSAVAAGPMGVTGGEVMATDAVLSLGWPEAT